ncbi:hypothetical protein AFA91_29510 [Mycolicibacterium goodii]|uniref:Alanine, arginine and proline rich protein n=1 Tax=Mycolicibacterium goodii TaxID=134601 RepID=A0A0K0XD95_MYCGD|nr:hypothetical protein AFA91_29510 [Mycolicibacterium goodii]
MHPSEAAPPTADDSPQASRIIEPVVDYEPPVQPVTAAPPCPAPTVLHRHTPRTLRLVPPPVEQRPHDGAGQFAAAALRRVLEVVDRRRSPAQLRTVLNPTLIDAVVALSQTRHGAPANLRRVRLRAAGDHRPGDHGLAAAAEVFATYTRGPRVRAIAARVELLSGRWQVTALQIG